MAVAPESSHRSTVPVLLGDKAGEIASAAAMLQALRGRWDEACATRADQPPGASADIGPDRTSIVMVTHNQLMYTQMALLSIRLMTAEPYELIVIDNASNDGTCEFLEQQPDVKLVKNRSNRGFPAASNQGIRLAQGSQILLLNNDVIVTAGWLTALLEVLRSQPDVALVGPLSNNVSGSQQMEVNYTSFSELEDFAADLKVRARRQHVPTTRLVGFCLLFPKRLSDEIGLLDEQFGQGMFEDDDYCRRAAAAGYRALIVRDSFVHHFGSKSFQALDISAVRRLFERNLELFCRKWDLPLPQPMASAGAQFEPARSAICAEPPALLPGSASSGPPQTVQVHHPKLSLCMIVRDNERTILPCLDSIRPWVDELVVVDTGSVDRTVELVKRFDAQVHFFPWCDDFSAARNESLRHAQGEWLFWMDSDDTIDETNARKLRALFDREIAGDVLGFVMQVHCPGPELDPSDVTIVDHVKVVRNNPQLRFTGRIHEQLLPSIKQLGGRVEWTDLFVLHSGYDHSPEGQERKTERDLKLLHLELQENPEHPFTLFNLGMTHSHIGRHREAVDYLDRCLKVSAPADSHAAKACATLVYSLREMGNLIGACESCQQALTIYPNDPELRFRWGVLCHATGRYGEAIESYRAVLEMTPEKQFKSIDIGIMGSKCRQNLALVLADAGRVAEAEAEWRRLTRDDPGYRRGWRGLADLLLSCGRFADARTLADEMVASESLAAEGHLLRGRLAKREGRLADARLDLERAVAANGADLEPLNQLCQLLFEQGDLEAADAAITRLLDRDPADAAAWLNLGTIALRRRQWERAITLFHKSLELRPAAAQTKLYLAYALEESGRLSEALAQYRGVVLLEPENSSGLEAIARLQARGV